MTQPERNSWSHPGLQQFIGAGVPKRVGCLTRLSANDGGCLQPTDVSHDELAGRRRDEALSRGAGKMWSLLSHRSCRRAMNRSSATVSL